MQHALWKLQSAFSQALSSARYTHRAAHRAGANISGESRKADGPADAEVQTREAPESWFEGG